MNKKIKRSLLLAMVVMLFTVCLAFGASAETITGECGKQGDNVTWTYDTETGKLIIEGRGEIEGWGMATHWPTGSKFVEIREGVTNIPMYAFYECLNLESVSIPESVTSIGESAFSHSAIEHITLPDSIKEIGDSAFQQAYCLKSIELPKNLIRIGNYAFECCENLIRIDIPDTVEYIGNGAFSECTSLKEVTIPAGVRNMGYFCFSGCYNMVNCEVEPNNPYLMNDDLGVIYTKDMKELIQFPFWSDIKQYSVHEDTETIRECAFAYSFNLEEVILNNRIKDIELGAFVGCFKLKNINFPDTLQIIGLQAFGECYSLSNIILPANTTEIGLVAFYNCISLNDTVIKSMSANIDDWSINCADFYIDGISHNEYITKSIEVERNECNWEELEQYRHFYDDITYIGTLYCHPGSTAEAYAIENGIDYVTQHFYGEWISDFDNMLQYRVCETCGMREERPLTQEEIGGIEIITPDDPDHDFEVDEKEPGSDSFVLVQEILGAGIENCNVLKVFDITYKNKDGVHVQPDGSVMVKLPLDWEKDGIYKVYRVNDDGTYTDMNATRQGSHMVFETDHFSLYVIVDESEQKPDDTPERDFFQKIFDWFRQLLDLLIALFK